MNQIMLSFLCGAAFIGGAVAVFFLVALVVQLKDKKSREEIHGYWRSSLEKHDRKLLILARIAAALEKRKDCAPAAKP